MKIKELLTEGPLDFAKGLFKTGSLTGAKAASQQAAGQKELQGLVNNVIGKWNLYYGQTQDQNIAAWAKKFFGRDVSGIQPPNVSNAKDVNSYITALVKAYKAGQLDPVQAGSKYKQRQSAVTPIQPQQTSAAPQSTGTIGALGKRGAAAPAQPQAYQSQMGVTVRQASDAGIVLNYRNRNYMLNDTGQWSLEGKNAASDLASGQLAAEMDKVAKSTGYM